MYLITSVGVSGGPENSPHSLILYSVLSLLGDFNFHFDDCSDGQVMRLKSMLSDFGLTQLVQTPMHRRGHILDWVVVRSDVQ